ncbi:5-formyltetrahydrofolate cyclo-ligase [Chryseobacterium indologenes]|uniref:5-formyltetrahydrofolate cyclo-ligase n=2 Tax=Weeksellaceae TaxID=2762318 RepID=A0AAD0YYC1_CHRID|nr:5-formyltetrahydrofolate cyclo-ligase [Chryseobacterium indologenes]ASE63644.1 5-formyltetrahydrofolate cyclo-ligase [Chryseobacterium indologenes]AYZ37431.1 5-formyltetrahydrofolate cyclo-ligase [Chryseobacterium indologenes]AZB19357.1 5-formyltetrahydrofolate cyclo-ligase [Chryseobacterium indologenes]MBF6646301.1 5-formyltetrahydrofolate cyclo-ligase [Chryseobacterium indologenes]MBU3049466.1 5-formyltetrahydrofolate cyclo-ligase [Chryseobacterium indologenes]
MQKAELRKQYIQKRKALSSDEAFLLSERIFQNFVHYFDPKETEKVHIFLPILEKKEVDTQIFINYFFEHQIRVFVPKVAGGQLISVEIFQDTTFVTSSWGIPEPVSDIDSGEKYFDYVITPLLYCDRKGNRVGYGKGFYDGLFQNVLPETKKIGVNYFDPDEYIDDVWENDVPLDYLVTPAEVLSFFKGLE